MKKILIALPLVLIMILSMVPVMAANTKINVPVTYYKTPEKKDVLQTETRAIEVDEAILKDANKLEAAVEAAVKAFGFPMLNTDVQPAWTVKATATAESQGAATFAKVTTTANDVKLATVLADLKGMIKFDNTNLTVKEAGYEFATQALLTTVDGLVDKIVGGTITEAEKTIVLAATDVSETGVKALDYSYVMEKAGAVTAAKVSAIAYPNCLVDPKDPVKTWCPELCDFITVRVFNAYDGKELVSAARKYKVDPHKLPTFEGIYNHYVNTYMPRGYQILKEWNLQNRVKFPTAVEKDCTITIWVLPLEMKVNVYHVLQDCCIDLNGNVKYNVWKVFEELDQTVPFIEYHTDLVINHDKAKVYAATRLQKINATDFIFQDAFFDDGLRLDSYMTGEVYDLNGNKVAVVENENPSITILYTRAGCDKEEEKVDNATVENNANTQAPVTASGTQLPATGAKDVTAFFLSAVALLGLGIFFAKKH